MQVQLPVGYVPEIQSKFHWMELSIYYFIFFPSK